MKVLITGINGFIGAATARAFVEAGHEVAGMVRPTSDLRRISQIRDKISLIEGDLMSLPAAAIRDFKPELCVHHAWYAEPGKYPHAIENLESLHGTADLVLALGGSGCGRFAGIGTCFEYDFDRGWLREDSPVKPATLYAAAKAAMCTMLPKLGEKAGIATTWIRLFYQYGPREDTRRLVPAVIRAMLRGEKVDTTLGEQVRDFLHVEDVGTGILHASSLDGIVNVGSGVPVTVRKIVETIGNKLGRLELANFGARPYNPTDPPFVVANSTRLKTETSWQPRYDLESGLAQTIEWWESEALSSRS
ncbi:MAG TPA: NAD(P)-dependent oxidoreductase [Fimbriimonadaceae bacterium]|nr:NAD(P)-dependent oxidoreductase [Fimbriimonadaceae bacterium]